MFMFFLLFHFWLLRFFFFFFFFFNDTATTEIYTLSLHDALPIRREPARRTAATSRRHPPRLHRLPGRSEEHTSELQSQSNLVCRLLLEKKKKQRKVYLFENKKTTPT